MWRLQSFALAFCLTYVVISILKGQNADLDIMMKMPKVRVYEYGHAKSHGK